MDFETSVKLNIYETIAATTEPPTPQQVAEVLDSPVDKVEEAFQSLTEKRLLVLEPGKSSKIRMAPPFSGIETIHKVNINNKTYYANCSWDAFGISAALHQDADITSTCEDCGANLEFQIRNNSPVYQEGVSHFAIPAAHWWDDIVYT